MSVDIDRLQGICADLLDALGQPEDAPGLKDTPRRWARMWQEFIEYDPGETETLFNSIQTDQMVAVQGLRVWSSCEHHLLPFWCDVSIGYLCGDKVLGLSKFARIAHQCAHRLQIQERLIHEIADEIARITGAQDVAVIGRGEHLCMTMRGIKTEGHLITSVMRGRFRHSDAARAEFMDMVRR